jgi:hypothetical protein
MASNKLKGISHKINYVDISGMMSKVSHGTQTKTLMVLHETVSPDIKGIADMQANENYLVSIGYGIHGLTDAEGNMAWAYGCGNDIFWQCGGVNEISDGIEQVSPIPTYVADKTMTIAQAKKAWANREVQLHATAQLVAAWHLSDVKNHILEYVPGDGKHKGVTTHWDVSQFFAASEGHTDCHPVPHGGYYPIIEVVDLAKNYAQLGYHF